MDDSKEERSVVFAATVPPSSLSSKQNMEEMKVE